MFQLDEIDIFPASIASPHEAMWTSIGGCLTQQRMWRENLRKCMTFRKWDKKTGKQNYSNVNFRRSTNPWEWMNPSTITNNNNNNNDKYKIYNSINVAILVFFAKTTKNNILMWRLAVPYQFTSWLPFEVLALARGGASGCQCGPWRVLVMMLWSFLATRMICY